MTFNEFILTNEVTIRLSFFFGIFAIMAIWEVLAPRRILTVSKTIRWMNNLGLIFFNIFVLRILFPAAAVGVAAFAQTHGWGLLNYYQLPALFAIIITVVAMDFIIYLQHVMVHAIPLLWRIHRVHHADLDYDVTTGARFHTIEIILSMLIKFATIIVLGAPVVAVVIFEVVLNALAMFNHGNVGLPKALDKFLHLFIVTPDMHRIHHSVEGDETNSNFGFNLTWWDRLFGTYREQPRGGQLGFTIGIHKYRNIKQTNWFSGMMMLPFKGKVSEYAINTRNWNSNNNTNLEEE
ncbi:MAG: sterol desaturase family protein [gamma proteobacterium symbiont of Taylorina sp.]|nr:sterol desaturase family protein [gamma proteobacterium symbiont of Taylorina sp.]